MNEEKSCRINEIDYEEREEEPLSPTARTLLHGDPSKTNCHVIGIFGFKKSLDINIVKHELMHNLIKHPRFSSKLVSIFTLSSSNFKNIFGYKCY